MIFSVIELVRPHCANRSQLAKCDYKITSKLKKLSDAKCTSHAQVAVKRLNFLNLNGEDVDKVGSLTEGVFLVRFCVCVYLIYERVYEMIFNWFIAEHFPSDKFSLHFDPIKRNMSVLSVSRANANASARHLGRSMLFAFGNLPHFRHIRLISFGWIHLIYSIRGFFINNKCLQKPSSYGERCWTFHVNV